MSTNEANLGKYVRLFALYYAAAVFSLNLLLNLIDLDLGSALEFVLLFGVATAIATKFIQEQLRVPSVQEKRKLSFYCMLASILVSALHLIGIFLVVAEPGDASVLWLALNELPLIAWVIIVSFSLGLLYLVLHLAFGWSAKRTFEGLKARGKLA